MISEHRITRRGWLATLIDSDGKEQVFVGETVGELCDRIRAQFQPAVLIRRDPLYQIARRGPIDAAGVAIGLGITTDAAAARLARAVRAGWMRRVRLGLYEVSR